MNDETTRADRMIFIYVKSEFYKILKSHKENKFSAFISKLSVHLDLYKIYIVENILEPNNIEIDYCGNFPDGFYNTLLHAVETFHVSDIALDKEVNSDD